MAFGFDIEIPVIRRSLPLLMGSVGLILIAGGLGDVAVGQVVNSIFMSISNITHQPPIFSMDTSGSSLYTNIGIFLVVLSAITYLLPIILKNR